MDIEDRNTIGINGVIDITFDPRVAGEIRRYHTWSVHRDQSVGEHSWQIMRIMLAIWPRCPRRLLIHAVIHDMPEMGGDISYPFKVIFPELKSLMTRVENYVAHEQMNNGRPSIVSLSPYEHLVFKICEWIEMWEYGLHEHNLGNRYAEKIVERMIAEIGPGIGRLESAEYANTQDAQQHPGLPAEIRKYVNRRMDMEGQRT